MNADAVLSYSFASSAIAANVLKTTVSVLLHSSKEFKQFVSTHPELIKFVNSGKMTWQKFYEMYSLYGKNNEVWKDYLNSNVSDMIPESIIPAISSDISI